jgi:hypothetical protein
MQLKMVIFKISLLIIYLWSTLLTHGQKIETTKLSVNSSASEIGPFLHDSVLYFVSNRKNSVLVNVFNQENEHLYDVYKAPLLKNDKIGKVGLFQPAQKNQLPAGSVAISPDGKFHIVTRNKAQSLRQARSSKASIPLGLFQSQKMENGQWGPYSAIPFSEKSESSFGQPSISSDGKKLFFVSDIIGGQGKTDIYMSTRTVDGWSEPLNVGAKINTVGRELFPYYHPSGKLYFSSDGHNGLGGIDIFYSTFDGEWSEPIRLSEPINSTFDDFSCAIFNNETSGYFASNREGSDDIYSYTYVFEFCENPTEVVEENYCFTFFESTAEALELETLKYRWEFSDGHKAEGLEVDHCFAGPGVYQVNLNVIDAATGEQQYNVASYELPLERPQQVYFSLPEKTKSNQTIVLQANLTGFEDAENTQYFWDLGEEEKLLGETISYKFRKKGTYQVRCEAFWGDNQKLCSYQTIIVE